MTPNHHPDVSERQPLSPGAKGKVWNPIIIAEFRRWKARPITYSAMVIIALAGIIYNYKTGSGRGNASILVKTGLVFGDPQIVMNFFLWLQPYTQNWPVISTIVDFGAGIRDINFLMDRWLRLVMRPSTIIPLLMVWRALMSFREAGFYKNLRTTFLKPRDFLWGIVGIPFWISAIILVLYTGWILSPGIVESFYAIPPSRRTATPIINILGVLLEGGLNGAMICFIGLYFGLRWKARLGNIVPVILIVLFVQFIQAIYMSQPNEFNRLFLPGLYEQGFNELSDFETMIMRNVTYFVMAFPKLIFSVLLWILSIQLIRKRDALE